MIDSPDSNNSKPEMTADELSLVSGAQAEANEVLGLPKIISFDSLARCGDEIWIENGGQIYRLRRTRQGKLILTK